MAAWTVPMSNGMDLQSPPSCQYARYLPRQEAPPDGSPRGYVRMATMDGKTLKHWAGFKEPKCALDNCQNPLFNFKNGRFCEAHLELQNKCGIIPCSQPIHSPEALTCDNQSHIDWHKHKTIQWSCRVPIGWGKCYRSESTPQVLSFLNKIWEDYPDLHPNILCHTRCNPAPTNGSQPYLVLTNVDDNRVVHQTWAFNTETAEQLNSWLNGFELQLQQMTDVNYDFFIHVLMMIYGATVEKQIVSKGRELKEEFWEESLVREAEEGQKRGIKPVVNGGSHWSSALVTGFQ
ncbi:hypothetical protein B0H10DRAFT_2169974 [Mycena sp. CBHHK59/15]|nr:hypothetical protein B0H10DRAFT_2169974 [Mycena sp. CBHHK59/15]